MKKFISFILAVSCTALCAVCGTACTTPGENSASSDSSSGTVKPPVVLEDNSGMIDTRYDLKTYLYPLWKGSTVYNETLWFAGSQVANLMYAPETVLSVRSYDLATEYQENVDFVVDGKTLVLTAGSKIPYLKENQFYRERPNNSMIPVQHRDGGYVYANEGTDISSQQVVVTYTHSDGVEWNVPEYCGDKLPKTMQKLENGEDIKILFYGDSITVGANSSEFLKYGPRAESYANMVKSYIAKRYPSAKISFTNNAVGGTDSNWGIDRPTGIAGIDNLEAAEGSHFTKRVLNVNPDLLFIAYGMNDQESYPVNYEANIGEMIERVRAQNPNVEIVLVSGMIANPDTYFHNKDYYEFQQALFRLANKYSNVGVAPVYNSVTSLYATGKRFTDCTANNVNHPNDFMMRVYAQTVICAMFGEDYIDHI